ncbi:hypothetical protein UO65_5347 [Actinokineospora spheciospongiae]|uniref:DUF916 domain-containing protein n=1 Tax=Actinokineospora spheciospongiae TaxID=909613 RepID=W7ISJ7_9PSEU|nr:DUF916 domain-containing protein [Actinokineospora spheciospongiae]EWC59401.1 hypothetical protein UO65_5347 [Actinokineospora spheciospongiae]
MRTLPALCALVAALALAPAAPAAAQPERLTWSVTPARAEGPDARPRFEYTVEPGMRYDDHLAVRNLGGGELTVDLYAADAVNTDSGGFDLLARDEHSPTLGAWVTLTRQQVVVAPRSTAVVPFSLTVPDDAEPGDHVGGLVAAVTTGGQVRVERRVGARLYARVAGPVTPALRIDPPAAAYRGTLNPAGPGEVDVTWTAVNDGNIRVAVRPSVRVHGPFGLTEVSWTGDTLPELLPGNAVTLTRTLTGVWPLGPLTAHVEAEPVTSADQPLAGAVDPATAETTVWAVPWTALGALLLLSGTLTALWRVRRRTRALTASA